MTVCDVLHTVGHGPGAAVLLTLSLIAMMVSECLAQRRRREAMEKAGVAKAPPRKRLVNEKMVEKMGQNAKPWFASPNFQDSWYHKKQQNNSGFQVLRQILDKLSKKGMQLQNHGVAQVCDTLSPQSVAKESENRWRVWRVTNCHCHTTFSAGAAILWGIHSHGRSQCFLSAEPQGMVSCLANRA